LMRSVRCAGLISPRPAARSKITSAAPGVGDVDSDGRKVVP
jgi:hypothetical protein